MVITRHNVALATAAMAALLASSAGAFAQQPASQAPRRTAAQVSPDGYRTATRLGGARRFYTPLRNLNSVKRMAAQARVQKDLGVVFDKAGVPSLTPEIVRILQAADPAVMKDTTVGVGQTLDWMALKNRGRADIIQKVRWGGARPFPAWEFVVDDGSRAYTFVLPKACGNLALVSARISPKAEEAAGRAADEAEAQRRRDEEAAARKRAEEEAARKKQAEEEARQAELRRSPGCGITTTRTYAKGVHTIEVDASGSATGPAPAVRVVVSALGPDGQPFTFVHAGKPASELTLTAPFKETITARKVKPGTYTLKVVSSRDNKVAADSTCEASFVVEQMAFSSPFIDGAFGKERRMRENEDAVVAPGAALPVAGFCAPLFGISGGYNMLLANGWSVAPRVGVAINFDDGGNSSLFAEAELNKWTEDRKTFFGTGLGWWDLTHGDSDDVSWLLHVGRQMVEAQNGGKLFFIGEGRLMLGQLDDIENNYQFWAGLRYYLK